MPRLRSHKARQRCESKVKYRTWEAAFAAAKALKRDTGYRTSVYRCPGRFGEVRHWHVTGGHPPKGRL